MKNENDVRFPARRVAHDVNIKFSGEKYELIDMIFKYKEDSLVVKGRKVKNGYYQTKIVRDGEDVGSCYFWVYTNERGCVITGDWHEDNLEYELWGKFEQIKEKSIRGRDK